MPEKKLIRVPVKVTYCPQTGTRTVDREIEVEQEVYIDALIKMFGIDRKLAGTEG